MYLNCHTYYSLRFGTLSEVELFELAQSLGVKSMALTDINNTSACMNFIRMAPTYGIKPLIGIDFRNGNDQVYIGIAKNNKGYLELNNFLSEHSHNNTKFPQEAPHFENAFIIYPYLKAVALGAKKYAAHERIGIHSDQISHLTFSPLKEYTKQLVVLQSVTFKNKLNYNTHRLLRAIDNNTLLSKLPKSEEANRNEVMISTKELACHFRDYPNIMYNTAALIEACEVGFDFNKNRMPQNQKYYLGSDQEDYKLIIKLCKEGLLYRYGEKVEEKILQRLEMELEIISKMGFISYFLINWDIIRYAQHKNYFYVGRGSGANSLVAYLLRITDVDPVELDLYFERFINLYRTSPPDFDIDFSWRDRNDVTKYIFSRFENTALLATYSTFKYKAAVRELGKVFGVPKQELDVLSKDGVVYENLDPIQKLVVQYAKVLHNKPNYLSVHSSGILISEQPIHSFSATNMPPKGFATTQFDMVIAEDVGLYKFDILGQRGLSKIKECLSIVEYNQKPERNIDIHDIKRFKEDVNINNMIKEAQCIACFYVESPAMRMLLKKLKVDNYLGLVAASSIIRPGVAKSGMMREYILRHRNPKRAKTHAHPLMIKIMPDTYGVMVYQEDVIKVAHYYADISLSEADVLRRGMSGKFRSREEFDQVKRKFFSNSKQKGHAEETTKEIWRQIESFAGYAFAKGHSASYAVESYQTLFLKVYYPLEYLVATVNNGGGFYSRELYVHEARMLGAKVHAPCVNKSFPYSIIQDKDIYLGFTFIHSLEDDIGIEIAKNRAMFGGFKSLIDFVERIPIGIESLAALIRVGAFRFLGEEKRKLLWKAHSLLNKGSRNQDQMKLFKADYKTYALPSLPTESMEDVFDQMELIGFPLSSPFRLLAEKPSNRLLARHFEKLNGQYVAIYGYLVTRKRTTASSGKNMFFGTFLDQSGHFIDTVHFPPVAARYPFRGKGIYLIRGKVVEEFDFLSLEVISMEKMAYVVDPRYSVEKKKIPIKEKI